MIASHQISANNAPSLLRNIAAGTASQLGIYVAQLASLPYLARMLGPDGLGQVVYIQSIMALIILFVDFGFSWSAIKIISTSRNDKKLYSRIFFSIWAAQWLLTLVSGAILALAYRYTKIFDVSSQQLFYGYLIVVGYILFPFWLLHGLENMKVSTTIQLISKLGTIPLLLLLIKLPTDIDMAILFFAFCNLLAGLLFIIFIIKSSILEWQRPTFNEVTATYRSGWHTFIAKINISLCSLLIPVYLNNISGPSALGLYNLADKVKNLIISLTGPIAAALFPRMSLLAKTDKNELLTLGFKTAAWQLVILTPICISFWIFSEDIATLIGGNQFANAASTIRWLAILPMLTATSNILGMQIMLPLGMEKALSKINILGLIAITVFAFVLIPFCHAEGAAISLLFSEIIMMALMAYRLRLFIFK